MAHFALLAWRYRPARLSTRRCRPASAELHVGTIGGDGARRAHRPTAHSAEAVSKPRGAPLSSAVSMCAKSALMRAVRVAVAEAMAQMGAWAAVPSVAALVTAGLGDSG